jgi:YD repeat-containing protein
VYGAAGQLKEIRAFNAKGSGGGVQQQTTRYLYESLVDRAWATNEILPDSSDTDSSGTDQVKYDYDLLGRLTQRKDQRGVDHRFDYDSKGRLVKDRIINSVSGVDLSVKRFQWAYDDLGRVTSAGSYDAGSNGNIVNEVTYSYNGWGRISQTWQAHDGAVNGSTPTISYTHADGASGGEAKYVRLTGVVYPGGEDIYYAYPSSGIGNALNRIEAIADNSPGTTRFAE